MFDNFPYTNFHELNLDWIIKIAKDFLDQYTSIQDTITTGLEDLDAKAVELQNLLDDWYNTHSADIANQLSEALADISTTLTSAIASFNESADAKGAAVIASIPDDYTTLSNLVTTINKWGIIGRNVLNNTIVTSDNFILTIDPGIYFVTGVNAAYLPTGFSATGTMMIAKSKASTGYLFAMYVDTNGNTATRNGYYIDANTNGWSTSWNILSKFDKYDALILTSDNDLMNLAEGVYEIADAANTPYLPSAYNPFGNIIILKSNHYYTTVMYVDVDGRVATRAYYTVNNTNTWYHNYWTKVGVYPVSGNLANIIDGDTYILLKGAYTLNTEITLAENQHIVGTQAVVTCGVNAKITMANGSSIEGVKFVGTWNPNRQHGDGTNVTQYGFVPIISESDLATGNSNALFGSGNTKTDALIYIAQNKGWNTKVSDCIFVFFDKAVVYAGGKRHFDLENPIVCNNYFVYCRTDIIVDGEFERIYGNIHYGGCVGTMLILGNSNQYGEIYKCMDCGIYYPADAGAHNEITSVEIAHCGICGVYIVNIPTALGTNITGCQIVDAAIIGGNGASPVDNVMICGCRIDTYIKFGTARRLSIVCSNVGKNYLYGNSLITATDYNMNLNRAMGANVADSEVNT